MSKAHSSALAITSVNSETKAASSVDYSFSLALVYDKNITDSWNKYEEKCTLECGRSQGDPQYSLLV